MKRIAKTAVAMMLAVSMLLTAACGKNGTGNGKEGTGGGHTGKDGKTLYVAAINKGYGTDWLAP